MKAALYLVILINNLLSQNDQYFPEIFSVLKVLVSRTGVGGERLESSRNYNSSLERSVPLKKMGT